MKKPTDTSNPGEKDSKLQQIQAYFRASVPEGMSLVEELLAERREEVCRELGMDMTNLSFAVSAQPVVHGPRDRLNPIVVATLFLFRNSTPELVR